MKRLLFSVLILISVLILVSCQKEEKINYTVDFMVEGSVYKTQNITTKDSLLNQVEEPTKDGYHFIGWFTNLDDESSKWKFEKDLVKESFKLYAKFGVNTELVTVTFDLNGGQADGLELEVSIQKGQKVAKPTIDPTKEDNIFVEWQKDSKAYDFTKAVVEDITLFAHYEEDRMITEIEVDGKIVVLDENNIYINELVGDDQLNDFIYRSLNDAVAKVKTGTEQNPVNIYLEPNVYWVDDRFSDNKENNLIGLKIEQEFVHLIGLGVSRDDVVIAGNRGQTQGAIGNWTVLGITNGFRASNLTIGNYCSYDLVYKLDPSKNVAKRTTNRVQAQVLINANGNRVDKVVIDNCNLVSFLNLLATRNADRVYIKNSYLQCTDDALTMGESLVFENCTFDLHGNHPSWSPARTMHAFLGCTFNLMSDDSKLFLSKELGKYIIIDGKFNGAENASVEWENVINPNIRSYVYNNTLNGKKLDISASRPEISYEIPEELLKAFKVNGEYNIYNLLKGDDDWDPANQKELMKDYANINFGLNARTDNRVIESTDGVATITVSALLNKFNEGLKINWDVDNDNAEITEIANNQIALSVVNQTESNIFVTVTAYDDVGNKCAIVIKVKHQPLEAPEISDLAFSEVIDNKINLNYTLNAEGREDISKVEWYRVDPTGLEADRLVLVNNDKEPLKSYLLTNADIGYKLMVKVTPQHISSVKGVVVELISSYVITQADVSNDIYMDFSNFNDQYETQVKNGMWTNMTQRPIDYPEEFKWDVKEEAGFSYGDGSDGTLGTRGLMTTGRGALLLYTNEGEFNNMSVVLNLSPHKKAGQGFGSATGQYMDVYIKYDTKTSSGYGLRIQRVSDYGNAVTFTLMEFTNGIGEKLTETQVSSAFVPNCTVELDITNNVFTAKVTTTTEQSPGQIEDGHLKEVNLTTTVKANSFGSFGVQHTGTVSAGNRTMLHDVLIKY